MLFNEDSHRFRIALQKVVDCFLQKSGKRILAGHADARFWQFHGRSRDLQQAFGMQSVHGGIRQRIQRLRGAV